MTANETYLETRKQIDFEIEMLKQKLEAMDIEQNKDVKNWGFAGSCGHILEEIQNLNMNFYRSFKMYYTPRTIINYEKVHDPVNGHGTFMKQANLSLLRRLINARNKRDDVEQGKEPEK